MSWFSKLGELIIGQEEFSDLKSSSIRDIINGEFLSKKFFKKQYGLIILVSVLSFLYVDNRYSCETQLARSVKLKKQIQDVKYESLTVSAEFMQLSRQSNVISLIKERGLQMESSPIPPIVIEDSVIQN